MDQCPHCQHLQQEYDEFMEQSREIEAEMDATLDQKQKIIYDLTARLVWYDRKREVLQLKLDEKDLELASMEEQLASVNQEYEAMKLELRQLEQTNDNLEQAARILSGTNVDIETLLHQELEKNALLEQEMEEKDALEVELQRLMEESRDLKEELKNAKKGDHATNSPGEQPDDGESPRSRVLKQVADMVEKLDLLQNILRTHRENRPLPLGPAPAC